MKAFISATSFSNPRNAAAQKLASGFFDEIVYNELGVPLRGSDILSHLEGCDAYIAGLDYLTADVIEAMPESVKVISRYGVGADRVDLAAARRRNITVTNTPGANSTAVCELAFALMLAAARNLPQLHNAVSAGQWPRSEGMELDALLRKADIVSLHVPLTEETFHLIDAKRIAQMKTGAVIINTARGGLIDEAAAAEAIRSGKLGGLGLDAFEQEPLIDSPLKSLPHVVFTPHTGAHTSEATEKMAMMSVQNAIQVLTDQHCPYIK